MGMHFEDPEHHVMSVPQYSWFLQEETVCASKNLNAHCFILAFPGFRNFPGSTVFVNYVAQGKFSSH